MGMAAGTGLAVTPYLFIPEPSLAQGDGFGPVLHYAVEGCRQRNRHALERTDRIRLPLLGWLGAHKLCDTAADERGEADA